MKHSSGSTFRWAWRLALVGLAVAVIGYVYFVLLRPVAQVAPAVPGKAIHAVPGSVEVMAEYAMALRSEIGGRIVASNLEPGRPVEQGEVLVQLDTGDIDLEIERTKNELSAARRRFQVGSTLRAEEENRRDALRESEDLMTAGAISASDLAKERRLYQQIVQRRELEEVSLRLALENLENALKSKEREKAKMTIVSPMNGVISDVSQTTRVGDLIGRDASIATLISSARTIEAKISEENFAGIRAGQRASVRFLGYGSQLYAAKVNKVLPTANPETQRYTVFLTVDLEVEKLVPGLTGEVSIVIGERDAKAIVPRRALRGNELMVVSNGRVELRQVELGYVALNQAEILAGLEEGELVLVEELDRFRVGDRVRTVTVQ